MVRRRVGELSYLVAGVSSLLYCTLSFLSFFIRVVLALVAVHDTDPLPAVLELSSLESSGALRHTHRLS